MIDPQLLRENPDIVRRSQRARRADAELIDAAIEADRRRREAIAAFEALRAEQNVHGKQVAAAPKEQKAALVAQAQQLAADVKAAQAAAAEAEARFAEVAGASRTSSSTACRRAARTTS